MFRILTASIFAQLAYFLSTVFALGAHKSYDDDGGIEISGGRRDDILIGTADEDEIDGGRGDDTLKGLAGDDELNGGRGDDTLLGGAGEDELNGGRGDDRLDGGADDDELNGGRGDDTLLGGAGEDELNGGRGDDSLNGGADNDALNGGRGDDTLLGGAGEDELNGGRGDDTLIGGAGDDTVSGGRGNDTVVVSAGDGADTIDGGRDSADRRGANDAGDIVEGDTIDLSGFDAGVRVDLDENNQGVLQAENPLSNATRPGLSEFGNVQSGGAVVIDALNDIENVIGSAYNDTIFGNAQNNVLMGGDGDDVLHPFGGTDFVDGGAGTDTLLLNGFAKGSHVDVEAGVAAFLDASPGVNTFANIENVNGSSVAGDKIVGDGNDNVLNGIGGDDILIGGGGNDTLIGGDNVDRARADAQGDNADFLDGGEGEDTLLGGAGDDILNGGTGVDSLTGGADSDTFFFASGDSGGSTTITDFAVAEDRFALDAGTFGLAGDADVVFRNVERDGDGLDAGLTGFDASNADTNVYVLQGAFANAGAAADAIAGALQDAGQEQDGDQSGFFVYFNEAQGRSRLFAVNDLDDEESAIQQIANLGDTVSAGDTAAREAALDTLATYTADNFVFTSEDELTV